MRSFARRFFDTRGDVSRVSTRMKMNGLAFLSAQNDEAVAVRQIDAGEVVPRNRNVFAVHVKKQVRFFDVEVHVFEKHHCHRAEPGNETDQHRETTRETDEMADVGPDAVHEVRADGRRTNRHENDRNGKQRPRSSRTIDTKEIDTGCGHGARDYFI